MQRAKFLIYLDYSLEAFGLLKSISFLVSLNRDDDLFLFIQTIVSFIAHTRENIRLGSNFEGNPKLCSIV